MSHISAYLGLSSSHESDTESVNESDNSFVHGKSNDMSNDIFFSILNGLFPVEMGFFQLKWTFSILNGLFPFLVAATFFGLFVGSCRV